MDLEDNTPSTVAIRSLNNKIAEDKRVTAVLLDIGDGAYVCLKN